MKAAFESAYVPTPKWKVIYSLEENKKTIFDELGTPIIIKPDVSGGSMRVGISNVVSTKRRIRKSTKKMLEGYRGWQLAAVGIVAEAFVKGAEFTVFLIGNHTNKEAAFIYPPLERMFHESLRVEEQFLFYYRL